MFSFEDEGLLHRGDFEWEKNGHQNCFKVEKENLSYEHPHSFREFISGNSEFEIVGRLNIISY